ncbi:MAG: VOC family protein [Actinomycetota bacterium]|nr:VOC family protein [Actinomycetota bacterium]
MTNTDSDSVATNGRVPTIARLAHVGVYVEDMDRAVAFYRDVLGLQVTDAQPDMGITFLSARPDVEHHELLLAAGRTAGRRALMLQQISWRCDTLDDVIAFHYRLAAHEVPLDMEVSHGNAIGIYFFDPEGNRNEVYWGTDLKATQVYLASIDLEAPPEEILARVKKDVEQHGVTGYVEPGFLDKQQIGGR